MAAVLSFIVPGFGHFYLGLWKPGIQLFGTYFILVFLNSLGTDTSPIFYIGVSVFSIISAVHAFKQAKRLNAGIPSQTGPANKSKTKNVFLTIILIFITLASIVAYVLFYIPDTRILREDIQLFRIVFSNKFSPNGYLNVPFLKDSAKYKFINIVTDFNKDGKFERYPISKGYQEEWVVQNMAVKTFKDQSNSFSILIPDKDIDGRKDFEVRVVLSRKTLEDWSNSNATDAVHQLKIDRVQKEDAGKYYKPDPEGIRIGGLPLGAVLSSNRAPSKKANFLDANSLVYFVYAASDFLDVFRSDIPDINQGFNECVPTSVTNSLLWLADHYGFGDKIPSSRDLINELKRDFNWNQYGVKLEKYLPGMDKFTERHNLPIRNYQIGEDFDADIVSKIADELNKGNGVLLGMEYREYDNAGNPLRVGGHMVTVVGVSDTENGQYLYINDPLSQIPGVDVYKVEGNKVVSYRFQGNAQTALQFAVAVASTVPAVKPIDSSRTPEKSPQKPIPSQAQTPKQALPGRQPPATSQSPKLPSQETFTWDGTYEIKEFMTCTVIYPDGPETTTEELRGEMEVKNNHIVPNHPEDQIILNEPIDDFGEAQQITRSVGGVGGRGEVLYNDDKYSFSKSPSGEITFNLVGSSYYIPPPPENPPCPITGSGRLINNF